MAEPSWSVATQTLVSVGGAGSVPKLSCPRVEVRIVEGPGAGTSHVLSGATLRVGSAPGNDLQLGDRAVSRHHFTVQLDERGVRIVDADSRNGTVVDGLTVRDAYLRPTSIIAVGATRLTVHLSTERVDVPLSSRSSFGRLLGSSTAMRRLFAILERVSPTQSTVLIEGETGTGKELVAEAIHEASARAQEPFVVFDCSAVSASLVESELFGHVRGAFTGAVSDHLGVFEAADGGTLFLDEIGELPLELQPKLLRALEQREIRKVGGRSVRKIDVRVVAASHRSLQAEVEAGRFREDLFYRLAVVHVMVPPLRERQDDIATLARHFAAGIGGTLSDASLRSFASMPWPGNARELRNAVERTLALGEALGQSPTSLTPLAKPKFHVDLSVPLREARDRLAEDFEQAYLERALEQTGGNVTRAAEIAGVNRKFIQRAQARIVRDDE